MSKRVNEPKKPASRMSQMIGLVLMVLLLVAVYFYADWRSNQNTKGDIVVTEDADGVQTAATVEPTPDQTGFVATDYVQIEIENYGTITAELYGEVAPITVENFMGLVEEGFYDGLTFHRIIDGFMIQGGDPKGNGTGGSNQKIKGEFSANGVENDISHVRGTLSMARSSDMDSASSQFFIMHDDADYLDGNYAGFGRVLSGMEVVDAIVKNTPVTDDNGTVTAENQPKIVSIKRIEKPAA